MSLIAALWPLIWSSAASVALCLVTARSVHGFFEARAQERRRREAQRARIAGLFASVLSAAVSCRAALQRKPRPRGADLSRLGAELATAILALKRLPPSQRNSVPPIDEPLALAQAFAEAYHACLQHFDRPVSPFKADEIQAARLREEELLDVLDAAFDALDQALSAPIVANSDVQRPDDDHAVVDLRAS